MKSGVKPRKKPENHGGRRTRLYLVWLTMRQRCCNQNNKHWLNYGGRGITVCDEWNESFASFRDWSMSHGYEHGLTLDRIDNDIGYLPSNCRFSTRYVQNNNQRQHRILQCSSIYAGVSLGKSCGRWKCRVSGRPNGGKRHCGYFATELEAALHWDRIVSEEIPSRACRNFPLLKSLYEKEGPV